MTTIQERFWSKVRIGEPDECWEWQTGRFSGGYGQFHIEKDTPVGAHRVAFLLTHGRWAEPMTLHTCDNRPCCNPAHLFEGTHPQNMADRDAKGRQAHGERNGRAKLTEEQVRAIKARCAEGVSHAQAAREFQVAKPTVGHIMRGERWAHLSG